MIQIRKNYSLKFIQTQGDPGVATAKSSREPVELKQSEI